MADTMEAQVDETPISPSAVSAPLESFFKRRPSAVELKERHILLDTTAAPALQNAQQHLLRQQAMDSLKKQLDHRPDRSELVERNILPDTNAAPALIAHAHDLEKNMRRNSLEHKLQNRPQLEQLIEKGIVAKAEE